ncbi:MAG TPA: YbjQ family protein [Candidatus Saccharimonadales bacterium]|nr:YbjQ family protein [Candidatus Saccharimonadales bacterium]
MIKGERGVNMKDQMLVVTTTTNDIPGYEVVEVCGEVFGLVVRSRNLFSNLGASLRTVFGGEVGGYTRLLADTREQALDRLREEAASKGGNAVVAMRFDSSEIGGVMSEVAAYGTAVKIKPQK